eukprot:4829599-Pleurochrysis_carterae.AAC.1
MDARAWVAINLGRSARTPGAFHLWLPHTSSTALASDVYFDETLFPWRPTEQQRDGQPTPIAVGAARDQPPGLPDASPPEDAAQPTFMAEAYEGKPARPRKALLHFSGPYRRADELSTFLNRFGVETMCVDNDFTHGGEGNTTTSSTIPSSTTCASDAPAASSPTSSPRHRAQRFHFLASFPHRFNRTEVLLQYAFDNTLACPTYRITTHASCTRQMTL